MARTIQTHELVSFSIQDWKRGQRWGDAVAGDVESSTPYDPVLFAGTAGGCLTNPKMSRGISGR